MIDNKLPGIKVEILDYRQCFDSMSLVESINDLWEAGIQDNDLSLIYKMNEKVQVAVKTHFGVRKNSNRENCNTR